LHFGRDGHFLIKFFFGRPILLSKQESKLSAQALWTSIVLLQSHFSISVSHESSTDLIANFQTGFGNKNRVVFSC